MPENLAVSHVLEYVAVVASDFRIDPATYLWIAMFVPPETGIRRIGHVVKSLCEIKIYETISILGFCRAREMMVKVVENDQNLMALMADIKSGISAPDQILNASLSISAHL